MCITSAECIVSAYDDLSPMQRKFVDQYLLDPRPGPAYRAAGYTGKGADQSGCRLLKTAKVAAALAEKQAVRAEAAGIEQKDVLERWVKIATADATKVTKLSYGACRYCWGVDHQYQWKTKREFEEAFRKFEREAKDNTPLDEFPNEDGGYGYKAHFKPHQDCPECGGQGTEYVRFKSTDELTPEERVLFRGVKVTATGGIQYMLADQDKALELVAKHLGMLNDTVKHDITDPVKELLKAAQGTTLPTGPGGFS
jgi:phage terminase small subunit